MNAAAKVRSLHVLLLTAALSLLSACATIGPPQPPSLELPKPPADLRASRKGDAVTLTWSIPVRTTDRKMIRSAGATAICRSVATALSQCGSPVGTTTLQISTPASKSSRRKTTASYTDVLPSAIESDDPAAVATYAIEVRNGEGRSAGLSNQVQVPLLRTIAPPELHATLTKDGVVLTWRKNVPAADAQSPVHYVYRAYRRLEGSSESSLLGEFRPEAADDMTFTDSTVEWEKTYEYRIETVSSITRHSGEEQIEGDDSPEIRIFAHDVFPPSVPTGLQAVFSGPGQKPFIDLIWSPVTDVDLDGYNVYRNESGAAPVKLNASPVKTPAYRDEAVVAGKHYVYSVSAIDVRSNESARSEEAGESVP